MGISPPIVMHSDGMTFNRGVMRLGLYFEKIILATVWRTDPWAQGRRWKQGGDLGFAVIWERELDCDDGGEVVNSGAAYKLDME